MEKMLQAGGDRERDGAAAEEPGGTVQEQGRRPGRRMPAGKSARIMAQEKTCGKLKEQIVELTKKKNSLHDQLDNAQLEIEQLKDEAARTPKIPALAQAA